MADVFTFHQMMTVLRGVVFLKIISTLLSFTNIKTYYSAGSSDSSARMMPVWQFYFLALMAAKLSFVRLNSPGEGMARIDGRNEGYLHRLLFKSVNDSSELTTQWLEMRTILFGQR